MNLRNFREVIRYLETLDVVDDFGDLLIPVEVDQAKIAVQRRGSLGRIAILAEGQISESEAKERKTGCNSGSNGRAVLRVVSSVLGRFP